MVCLLSRHSSLAEVTPGCRDWPVTCIRSLPRPWADLLIRISGNFWTRVSPTSGRGSRQQLWSGRSRSPADRAERADQGVIGGEPVPRRLAGIHDVRQAGKYRVGEPVAAQIVPNPLDWIELRAVGRQR